MRTETGINKLVKELKTQITRISREPKKSRITIINRRLQSLTATELKDLNWNKEVTRKGTRISNKEKKEP